MSNHRALPCGLALAALLLVDVGRAAPPDPLDDLLRRFAAIPGLQASFREEKRFGLLDSPLVSEGTIHYAPGRFARHATRPVASTVLVTGDRLVFGDAEGHEELDMGARPAVRPFVDSFLAVLRGDRSALERIHRIAFEPEQGPDAAWRLVLRPRVSPMDKVIDRLEVGGRGVTISRLLLVETGGDETETTFTDVDAARVYSPDEVARIFRLPARGG